MNAVVYIKFGEWDVRRSVVTGQLNRAMRYIDKMLDDGYRHVLKLQEQGKNATQYVLVSLKNFFFCRGQRAALLSKLCLNFFCNYF